MGLSEYSAWIKAQPGDVWRIYVNPARIPEWQTGSPKITDIRGTGAEPGSSYLAKRGPGTAHTTVQAADPPRSLVTRTEAYFGLRFDVFSELEIDGEGTRLGLRVETHWPRGLGLFGKLVESVILSSREGRKELTNLKALIERETHR